MIYLCVGTDSAYIKQKIKQEFLRSKTALEKVEFLDFSAYEDLVQDVVAEVSCPSMTAEKKVVIYDKCYFLSTSKEKVSINSEQRVDSLLDYISAPDPENDLYLIVIGPLAKGEIADLLKKKAKYQNYSKPTDDELKTIATQYFVMRNKKIDQSALDELIKRVRSDYSLLVNELRKLDTYSEHITLSDIGELVHRPLEDNIFALATHLVKGETAAALRLYRDLLQGGSDAYFLLAILASQFRFMCEVSFLVQRKTSESQIVSTLKANPYRVKLTRQAIGNRTPTVFHHAMARLFEVDKHSKLDLDNIEKSLELFLLNFSTEMKGQR